jgi:hypothetical protein
VTRFAMLAIAAWSSSERWRFASGWKARDDAK